MVSKEELISAINNRFGIVDNQLIWNRGPRRGKIAGYKQPDGYVYVRVTIKKGVHIGIHAHRILFYFYYGYLPDLIDHIDRDTTNNSKNNLRDSSKRQNNINTGVPKNNTTGYKGVYLDKLGGYCVYIGNKGKRYNIGRYSNLSEAVKARQEAEERFWYDVR